MKETVGLALLLAGCTYQPADIAPDRAVAAAASATATSSAKSAKPASHALDLPGPALPATGPETPARKASRTPPSQCEPGQQVGVRCWGLRDSDGKPGGRQGGPLRACVRAPAGNYVWQQVGCDTPIVLAFDDAPVRFTRPSHAAPFAIGTLPVTEWVSAATPWLALDRDGSGCIESQAELFGGNVEDESGFEKLARFDDDHDGRIDARDAAFARLALWYDGDQDRRCAPREIVSLATAGVLAIDLRYQRRPASSGSYEGEHAPFAFRDARGTQVGRVIDVHLAPSID